MTPLSPYDCQADNHGASAIEVDGAEYRLIVHDAEEGGFWAKVRGMPGCVSQGETPDELEANITDAIRCALEFR